MATTDNTARLHEATCRDLLREFENLTPNLTESQRFERFVETGVIDASRLLELVDSLETGIPLDSREGRDLADGSNSKLTCAYGPVNGQYTAYGWRVAVYNCEADVRVRFTRPKTGEAYKAHIPAREVRNIRYVTITDCVKGGPLGGKWGKYITKIS
jgi:hypothetical protein